MNLMNCRCGSDINAQHTIITIGPAGHYTVYAMVCDFCSSIATFDGNFFNMLEVNKAAEEAWRKRYEVPG